MENTEIKVRDEGSTDLQVANNGNSTMDKILDLIANGAEISTEKIEKMMDLADRHEAKQAHNAFNVAVAAFKAVVPQISKNRTVGYQAKGQHVGYKHVTLDLITNTINPYLSKHGLSTTWDIENLQDGSIKVTCELAHELGHSKKVSMAEKKDATGSKNSIQSGGSTITYLKRYTLECVTGITAVDDDDDGRPPVADTPKAKPPTQSQLDVIQAICEQLPPVESFTPNFETITAICMKNFRDYLVFEQVHNIAEHLSSNHKTEQIYMAVPSETEAIFEPEN